jgi:hypothetical protein
VVDRGHVEPNLQQASEFLTTLTPRHRALPAAREFAEQLCSLRTLRTDSARDNPPASVAHQWDQALSP